MELKRMQENDSTPLELAADLPSQCGHEKSSRRSKIFPSVVSRRLAPLNSNCIVCGAQNPNGLQLAFRAGSNGVSAAWVPKGGWESFEGTVHGGIITAVLDEAMSKAIIACGWEAFTVELRVRFHDRVSPGERLHVHGWIVEKRKRRILAEASLAGDTGKERAHAWAVFLIPRGHSPL
jgi:hypothetical protein